MQCSPSLDTTTSLGVTVPLEVSSHFKQLTGKLMKISIMSTLKRSPGYDKWRKVVKLPVCVNGEFTIFPPKPKLIPSAAPPPPGSGALYKV